MNKIVVERKRRRSDTSFRPENAKNSCVADAAGKERDNLIVDEPKSRS